MSRAIIIPRPVLLHEGCLMDNRTCQPCQAWVEEAIEFQQCLEDHTAISHEKVGRHIRGYCDECFYDECIELFVYYWQHHDYITIPLLYDFCCQQLRVQRERDDHLCDSMEYSTCPIDCSCGACMHFDCMECSRLERLDFDLEILHSQLFRDLDREDEESEDEYRLVIDEDRAQEADDDYDDQDDDPEVEVVFVDEPQDTDNGEEPSTEGLNCMMLVACMDNWSISESEDDGDQEESEVNYATE